MKFYMARLGVGHFRQPFRFTCSETHPRCSEEVLPHLQGCYAVDNMRWLRNIDICVNGKLVPLHVARTDIQKSMRRMVLVGTGYERPALSVPLYSPLFPKSALFDEMAVHFKCETSLLNKKNKVSCLIAFSEYTKSIPPSTRTIGIVNAFEACRSLTNTLTPYLQCSSPQATVTVHSAEAMPLSLIRLSANVTIIGQRSVYPLLAEYGTFNKRVGKCGAAT
jgi:hypothetical protein